MQGDTTTTSAEDKAESRADRPALERGTYEILRERLLGHATTLRDRAETLNQKRLELFGGTELALTGNERIRTENNCVPRDIVPVGETLLFGYNVFIGLRTETKIEDVLTLHHFAPREDGSIDFAQLAPEDPANFLADAGFASDFKELYRYYKDTRLLQLRRPEGKLLAVFQTGASVHDIKVFRWAVDIAGKATYMDNRGERDHVFPPSHDFEWTETDRDDYVLGRHPHVSILDQVFVETVGGDLTIKVEDNTEDGLGIYREDVDEKDQTLDDAQIHYAQVGSLILLKVQPYKETGWRYFVFNTRNQQVDRIDAIGQACVQLPEDHGLIFPGGYYLQNGETKSFDSRIDDMELMRTVRSPNGEDVLYVFHERAEGNKILLSYNLIRKQVQNPVLCHGFSLFDDGTLVVFRALSEEPTRVHPMQIWQTPFTSDTHADQAPSSGSYLETVGNAELVRGISDAFSLHHAVAEQEASAIGYEDLVASTQRALDTYTWLEHEEVLDLRTPLTEIRTTADLIVGEFEKVESLRKQTRQAVAKAETDLETLTREVTPDGWTSVDPYVDALGRLRSMRGHLISLKELRYVDHAHLDTLEAQTIEQVETLTGHTVDYLLGDDALAPYHQALEEQVETVEALDKVRDVVVVEEEVERLGTNLELLTEIVGNLEIDDATVRTRILEDISEVMGGLNRARALVTARRKSLGAREGKAEFAAQFKLVAQSVSGTLGLCDTPEKCDEHLARLMLQLEELEGRFGDLDDTYLEQVATKREDIYEAFSAKKQSLLDARQRRAGRLASAGERILEGIGRRTESLDSADALNAYFASDAMVAKLRDLSDQLRELGDSVRADELDSRLKAAREDASRGLRDRQDLFEADATGGQVIKLGRHRFSVNTQAFDLTMVPRGEGDDLEMAFHLTGTDFYASIEDPAFAETRGSWDQLLVSETPDVYRAEYLSSSMVHDAEQGEGGLTLAALHEAVLSDDGLVPLVRRYAAERYDEGYERGLHDHDAALILEKLLDLYSTAGLLRFAPRPRAMASLFWAFYPEQMRRALWQRRAHSLARLRDAFAHSPAIQAIAVELSEAMRDFFAQQGIELDDDDATMAGSYLFEELSREGPRFATSGEAVALRDAFVKHLTKTHNERTFAEDLNELGDDLAQTFHLVRAWFDGFLAHGGDEAVAALAPARDEAVVLTITGTRIERTVSNALASVRVEGLLGQHARVRDRVLDLRLDAFLARLSAFRQRQVPAFRHFQTVRHALLEDEREALRLDEYRPRVMSAFVRNRLIDQAYLPIIGDNLAKQLGAVGEGKRTDQMGLLLLISPPGYGKTTLMEYVAHRLGMIFVKVNGPALGHGVTSTDPSEAPNATARQEVEKINFALEMGNNVLLYLDDIQHTHPELLQKFISLCDAQRRMEGVWNGRTRTYDLRGKRFAICMAGNPYTESGEAFQIPDMLANRADTYNLGDILEGKDELFALSYLENALTSNPVLAPLTTRAPEDVLLLVRMAKGEEVPPDKLQHDYAAVELEEILSVLRKLLRVQEVLLAVNQQYIYSAAQDDAYRTEPRFQLQGSYRNMNKLAEKVVAVMNDDELEALLDDHYQGEAQTLTTGAEANLLKLRELRGVLSDEEQARWTEIKRGFARRQAMGGSEDDPAVRMIGQLGLVSDRLEDIGQVIGQSAEAAASRAEQVEATARDAITEQAAARDEAAAAEAAAPSSGELATRIGDAVTPWVEKLHETLEALREARVPVAEAPAAIAAPVADPHVEDTHLVALRAQAQQLTNRLDSVLERMADVIGAVSSGQPSQVATPRTSSSATRLPASGTNAALFPYLDRLDQTLAKLADGPRGAQIVQTLDPGVLDVLGRMGDTVGDNLLPLVKQVNRRLKEIDTEPDRAVTEAMDRSLKRLDELKGLLDALRKIDTKRLTAVDS